MKRQGVDPLETRREKKAGSAVAKAKTMTFAQCAKAYITAKQAGRRSSDHVRQWVQSLETYVFPVIGASPVDTIDLGLVMRVLERDRFWHVKPETASRVRGRIESILDWAKTRVTVTLVWQKQGQH